MINKKTTSENRRILQIAVPSIISNITVPLLGLIDVTIVGHLGSPVINMRRINNSFLKEI